MTAGPPTDDVFGATLAAHAERHQRELHVHCYRMLASFDEAEDAVQETMLRAWKARDTFSGNEAGFRAWLYRIATNVCLDMLRRRSRRRTEIGSPRELPWLQPYPDRLLDEVGPRDDDPHVAAVTRETVELAFLVALQVLPPRQRAALLLRDVLGLTVAETAAMLDTSDAAVNSALQRARATMQQHLPSHRTAWTAPRATAEERDLLERFIDAHQRHDAEAAVAIVAPDIRVTMPPYPWLYEGIDQILLLLERAFGPDREGDWRLLPGRLNRMPAAGSYLRRPGDTVFRAFKSDVLRIEDGQIAEITTFGPEPFEAMGLPPTLSPTP